MKIKTFAELEAGLNDYGKCEITGVPFKRGEDFFRVTVVRNFQSQGMPSEGDMIELDVSVAAFCDAPKLRAEIERQMSERLGEPYQLKP